MTLSNVDIFLSEKIGQIGKFQVLNFFLIALASLFAAFPLDFVFTARALKTRCYIPECDGNITDYSPQWTYEEIPTKNKVDLNRCDLVYGINKTLLYSDSNITCSPDTLYKNDTTTCNHYVYERTDSIVYDFNLECDEWIRALVGTISNIGFAISMPLAGYFSDKYGRKQSLILSTLFNCIFGVIRAFSVNYYMYVFIYMVMNILGGTAINIGFVLAVETMGPRYRILFATLTIIIFAIGQIICAALAYAITNWRHLLLVLYAPQVIILTYYILFSESLQWLISKGDLKNAQKTLNFATKLNHKPSTTISSNTFQTNDSVKQSNEKGESLLKQLFKCKTMLARIMITPMWWLTSLLIYYGLSYNSSNLYGNIHFNFMIIVAVEIIGYISVPYFINKVGRRITLSTGFFICFLSQLGLAFTPKDEVIASLLLTIFGKISIAATVLTLYFYTTELFPTVHRQTFLSFSSMFGRFGNIIAPLMPALATSVWSGLPSLIFSLMSAISAVLILFTPETKGKFLPNTMEEADSL